MLPINLSLLFSGTSLNSPLVNSLKLDYCFGVSYSPSKILLTFYGISNREYFQNYNYLILNWDFQGKSLLRTIRLAKVLLLCSPHRLGRLPSF
jgi:predicted P-loop ATPase/GTPase